MVVQYPQKLLNIFHKNYSRKLIVIFFFINFLLLIAKPNTKFTNIKPKYNWLISTSKCVKKYRVENLWSWFWSQAFCDILMPYSFLLLQKRNWASMIFAKKCKSNHLLKICLLGIKIKASRSLYQQFDFLKIISI